MLASSFSCLYGRKRKEDKHMSRSNKKKRSQKAHRLRKGGLESSKSRVQRDVGLPFRSSVRAMAPNEYGGLRSEKRKTITR